MLFPLKDCFRHHSCEENFQFTEAFDIIPIHRQCFPLCRNFDAAVESSSVTSYEPEPSPAVAHDFGSQSYSMTSVSMDTGLPPLRTSPHIRTPSPCILTQSPDIRLPHEASTRNSDGAVHHKRTHAMPPAGTSAPAPEAIQFPLQHERKIRGVDSIMFWFVSDGPEPIREPLRPGIRITDLYLHLHGAAEVQIWIWNSDGEWEMIEQGYVHPQLPDRRLWLASRDKPSWITRKTVGTYKGRQKQL